MKTTSFIRTILLAALLTGIRTANAQGMPKELHDNIHTLFDNHAKFTRKVEMTDKGYVAVTESTDPKLARILREHVSQMRERLQSGRMVRRWDPAFPEFIAHYDDITHRVAATKNGLKITATGKTPAAIKVAKNHAKIVSDFAKNGWQAHDTYHPLALAPQAGSKTADSGKPAGDCAACRKNVAQPASARPCCLKEKGDKGTECAKCRQDTAAKPSATPCCAKEAKQQAAKCPDCRKETR